MIILSPKVFPSLLHSHSIACQRTFSFLRSTVPTLRHSTHLSSNQLQRKVVFLSVVTPPPIVSGQASHKKHQRCHILFRIGIMSRTKLAQQLTSPVTLNLADRSLHIAEGSPKGPHANTQSHCHVLIPDARRLLCDSVNLRKFHVQ